MPRRFRALLTVALLCAATALSACGGGSSQSARQTIDEAFSTPLRSANISIDASLTLNGLKSVNGPIKLTISGPFISGHGQTIPKLDWDIAASASGQNFAATFISTGDDAFVQFQGQSYEVGKSAVAQLNQQIKTAASGKKKGLAQFGIHPRDWLTNAKSEGSAKIGGVDSDHVSAAFDVAKFLDDVNTIIQKAGSTLAGGSAAGGLTPQEKQSIEKAVNNPRVDIYVGKSDHVIRRLAADVSFSVPKSSQAKVNGLSGGTLSFSIEFSDVGKPQTITAPKNAQPISALTSKLGGSLGSALGGGGGTSGSTGGSGTTALQKYSKCLQNANPSKPAELQKCANLLK